jgi:hypothetical protein
MPWSDTEEETGMMSKLSAMDSGEAPADVGMPSGAPTGMAPPTGTAPGQTPPPGGPGPGTPQEQQALKLLMQGAVIMRRATEVEPSIRYIIDDLLQKAYLMVTKHYGMEQEGKLALQQAKLRADRNKAVALTGPPKRPTQGI